MMNQGAWRGTTWPGSRVFLFHIFSLFCHVNLKQGSRTQGKKTGNDGPSFFFDTLFINNLDDLGTGPWLLEHHEKWLTETDTEHRRVTTFIFLVLIILICMYYVYIYTFIYLSIYNKLFSRGRPYPHVRYVFQIVSRCFAGGGPLKM